MSLLDPGDGPPATRVAGHANDQAAPFPLLTTALALYVLFWLYLKGALGFELLGSDALKYWEQSFTLRTPYSTWWVPGYPAMIAVVRVATFGVLPPVAVLMTIAGTFFVIGVAVFARLATEVGIPSPRELSLLFAAYPFVGLTYSVYPVADAAALGLLVLCLLYYQRQRWVACAVYFGLMILTHKATWFFALPLLVLALVKYRDSRRPLLLATVPLLTLITAGAVHHGDVLWSVRGSMKNLLTSQTAFFPLFDGLAGSLIGGGVARTAKVLLVLIVVVSAALLLRPCYRRSFWIGGCVALALILMGVVLNRDNVWALVRFSRVLVLPLGYVLLAPDSWFSRRWGRLTSTRFQVLFGAAIVCNIAFGYYMAKVYFTQ